MTPHQLDALLKRHRYQTEKSEFMFGQLTSWIANTGFRATEKLTAATDFMPSAWAKRAKAAPTDAPKRIRMTTKRRETLAAHLRASLGAIATRTD